ncbi:FKBP-type peptidyl-prolyl cis-trans isomerase [soil metagenome]
MNTFHASRAALALMLCLTLLLSACATGDDEATGSTAVDPGDADATEDGDDVTDDDATGDGGGGPVTPGEDAFGVEVEGEEGEKPEITLPGGEPPTELVVVDLVEGDGDEVPADVTVTTHYVGVSWLNDGAQFDASWDRGQPISFPLDQVIAGWTQGIPGMRVGGQRLLIIPPDLGYGAQPPSPDIAAGDTLVFVIDMIGFEGPPEPVEPGTDTFGVEVEGELGEKPEITLPGGEPPTELVVVDLIEGDGPEAPAGATVTTHYVGVSWLNDGEQFDASWDRGDPISFPLSGVIAGWTQGIPGMREGGRRLLIIPPELAYGAQPPSPAIAENDTLVFVIDLVSSQ